MPSPRADTKPMHILLLTDRDWTHPQGGGTGTNLYGQVARWLAWGHRVTVIAGAYEGAAAVVEVVNGIAFLAPLWRWLRAPTVALVHHVHQDHYVAEMGWKGRIAAL